MFSAHPRFAFTVLKVRDDLAAGSEHDPGWYRHPPGTLAQRVDFDPKFAVEADGGMGAEMSAMHHGG